MTEALNKILEFAFDQLELEKLLLNHKSANVATKGLVDKVGFKFVGTGRTTGAWLISAVNWD